MPSDHSGPQPLVKGEDGVAPPKANPMLYSNMRYDESRGLTVDGVALADIAAAHSTPTYVYSIPRVLHNFRTVRDAFSAHLDASSPLSIHFSMKSNAASAVVRALIGEGAGIDCVSAGEVHKALAFGVQPDHIVFAGVGKSAAELEYAVSRGVGWFNVENERELELLCAACVKASVAHTRVALRVNPNVAANTHPSIATGHGGAKFGLPVDVVQSILKNRGKYPQIKFEGLHVHIGSQLGDVDATVNAVKRVVAIAEEAGEIKYLNVGGGFPVQYRPDQPTNALPAAEAFARAVAPLVKGFHVMLEPGRSIVADAGIVLTRSLYRKDQAKMTMLIVDASMVEVMRPALYSAYHDVVPVRTIDPNQSTTITTIVGPVCESTDVINAGVPLQDSAVQPDELFAIMTTGAYCSAMAGNYNARPLCAEVAILENGTFTLSRKRQTFDDLLRDEVL
jgi:diaminopimelate decarboxylase